MSPEAWIALATAAAALASLITIYVLLKGVRDQLRMLSFLVYTDRYSKIMKSLPFEARQPESGYRLDEQAPTERALFLSVMRDYFNLCSEEYWLMQAKKIDRRTWDVWENGMREVVRFPGFAAAWAQLRNEYMFFEEFRGFMDSMAQALQTEVVTP